MTEEEKDKLIAWLIGELQRFRPDLTTDDILYQAFDELEESP